MSPDPGKATVAPPEIRYILQLVESAAGCGCFAPVPEGPPDLEKALARLRYTPQDSFLHRFVLETLVQGSTADLEARQSVALPSDTVLRALLAEASDLRQAPSSRSIASDDDLLAAASPLILLRHRRLSDRAVHQRWAALMAANILEHRPLPPPGSPQRPPLPLFSASAPADALDTPLAAIAPCPTDVPEREISLAETIETAISRLARAGILVSAEMRHEASLSPIGLLRQWRLERRVHSGALRYRLGGFQTAYGRGFSPDAARAGYLMEIVERYSAYGEFGPEAVHGHRHRVPLRRAGYSAIKPALDPNDLWLEVPYDDETLHWCPGEQVGPQGAVPLWVPAQCVYLFCNLDEPDLFSALGSTGLGAGNTMDQARLAALLEVIERDAEATTPFDPGACFTVRTADRYLATLLDHYRHCGVDVQFQDLTGPLGVPCYKCFVVDAAGRIVKGTGAHPSGRRALLSALTETMYPYPNGPRSQPGLDGLPVRRLEVLPDHGSGSAAADLNRLERLLHANGLAPIYVDLTRADLGLPVARAIVPGLSHMADFDRFTRLNRRLIKALQAPAAVNNG